MAPYLKALFSEIYAFYPEGDEKHRKFISIFGFRPFKNKDGFDIYRWQHE